MSTQGGEYFLDVQIYCGFQEEMARFIYDKVDPLHTVAHSKIPNAKHGVEYQTGLFFSNTDSNCMMKTKFGIKTVNLICTFLNIVMIEMPEYQNPCV